MSEKRVLFIARINPELKKRFYDLVKSKYEGVRGGISAELEHVLAEHLRVQHTQIHTKLNPVSYPMRHIIANDIISELKKQGFWNQCPRNTLYDAIRNLRGSDYRTIKKWIRELLRMNKIKQVNNAIYEIM